MFIILFGFTIKNLFGTQNNFRTQVTAPCTTVQQKQCAALKKKLRSPAATTTRTTLGARLASRRIRRQETGRKVERGTRKKCMTELDRHNVDGDVQAGAVVRGEATWTRARDWEWKCTMSPSTLTHTHTDTGARSSRKCVVQQLGHCWRTLTHTHTHINERALV